MSHVIELFFDMGMVSAGTEITPLNFAEIAGFKQASGINMTPFDVLSIKRMSESYFSWLHKGKKVDCQAPYFKDSRTVEQQRLETYNKFKALGVKYGN